jgi:hypothetical protein
MKAVSAAFAAWVVVFAPFAPVVAEERPAAAQDAARKSPPPLPVALSPTARFRELLAAGPAEREALLARKSPTARALIESKLREFSALRPDEREIRLRLAQLQDSLRPLLAAGTEGRNALLTQVAEEDRTWIGERLVAWDALSEAERRDLLESERQLSLFVRQTETDPRRLETLVHSLPPEGRAPAEKQLRTWLALTPAERSRKSAAFSRFFDLSPKEREAALRQLSGAELRQMEKTLVDFASLDPGTRERCLQGFRQFEVLPPAEREQFLRNAERWKALSPNDRAAWRRLVGRALTPPAAPPLPFRETSLVSTNGVP